MYKEYSRYVDCIGIKRIYNTYLKPYIGFISTDIDIDSIIMDEVLSNILNNYVKYNSIHDLELENHCASDILNYFYEIYYTSIDSLLKYIDYLCKGYILSDCHSDGLTIIITVIQYDNKEEVNNNYFLQTYYRENS